MFCTVPGVWDWGFKIDCTIAMPHIPIIFFLVRCLSVNGDRNALVIRLLLLKIILLLSINIAYINALSD